MFGGFIRGIVGAAMTAGAVILFVILLANQVSPGPAFLVAVGVWIGGNYLSYASRHTVRTRR
jgi:hypothetical protein